VAELCSEYQDPKKGRIQIEKETIMPINMTPKPAPVAADGTEPFTPEQIVEHLRTLRLHIPDFGALTAPDSRSLRRTAHVDPKFVQAALNTIGAESAVKSAVGRSTEALTVDREDVGRWSAVEDELAAMLKGVASANLVRRHRIGLIALQAYRISRELVRNPDFAALTPHVEGMRRMNKFRRRRPRPDEPVTAPVTAAPKS
jgi:hypothetical protein